MTILFKKYFIILLLITTLQACVSSSEINQKAATSYTEIVNKTKKQGLVDDESHTAKRIKSIFYQMIPYADRENTTSEKFNWEITVVRSNTLNAWAMPGGKVMFFTGLVELLKLEDDEIATIIGHEMAHVLKEHGKNQANRGTALNILGHVANIALSIATGSFGFSDSSDLSDTLEFVLDKPFSRSAESEADEIGLFLMAKSGFDPRAAPNLWDKMSAVTQATGGPLAGFLSTHPTDQDRKKNLLRLMPKAMSYYQPSNNH